jgi:hypothetical protein
VLKLSPPQSEEEQVPSAEKCLFSENVEKNCAYCVHGKASAKGNEIFCKYKGVSFNGENCRKYKYDPLLRKPRKKAVLRTGFSEEDFSL